MSGEEGTVLSSPKDWVEPVSYTIQAVACKGPCRSGINASDIWRFEWNTPGGYCPKAFVLVFPLMIACECGGDLRERGGISKDSIEFDCPDGVVRFRLSAHRRVPTIAASEHTQPT
jgi:uncharacterized repeat protein (TIGR04076 family)